MPLKENYLHIQHVHVYVHTSFVFLQAGSQPTIPLPLQVMKPNELFYSKILPLLKEKGMSEQTPRKEWPHQVQLRVLKELMAETPADLLAKSEINTILFVLFSNSNFLT